MWHNELFAYIAVGIAIGFAVRALIAIRVANARKARAQLDLFIAIPERECLQLLKPTEPKEINPSNEDLTRLGFSDRSWPWL